jgi:hypothetical protein
MNVHMDCDGCEKRLRKAMSRIEGTILFRQNEVQVRRALCNKLMM